ncbi:MAG: ubiquinol-cytochrome c reductase iron-sulfur subunit [Fimbriimonadales bacterium]
MNSQTSPPKSQPALESPERRKLLGWLVGIINVAVFGAILAPVAGLVTAPLRRPKKPGDWVPVLDDSALADGETKGVEYRLKVQDGFYATELKYAVYLHRSGDQLFAFDPTCTHLGCRVEFQNNRKKYFCPCHGGVFKDNGDVESGPPPVGLNRHLVKVENGKILIKTDLEPRSA